VGAKIGAKLVVKTIEQLLEENSHFSSYFWSNFRELLIHQITTIAKTMVFQDNFQEIIHDYFLFTIIGTIITPKETAIFSIGDGVIIVNGEIQDIETFPNNAPPYLAYGCLNLSQLSQIKINCILPTQEVKSILIGTDGVSDLIQKSNYLIPGKSEQVGDISQFWQAEKYFKNPDMIRRKLALINRDITKTKQVGLLPDDTTLVVIKSASL
jgi:hypothetical protein